MHAEGAPQLVSVIIPTRNRAGMLGDALRSVELQSWRPIECIVVDDGSTDDTAEALRAWEDRLRGERDFVLRVLRQPHGGAPRARNAGLAAARGEFIQFLDSDDILLPGKLQRSVEALRTHPDLDYVVGSRIFVDDEGVSRLLDGLAESPPARRPPQTVAGTALAGLPAQAVLGFSRRSLCRRVGDWNETLVRHQDWEYTTRLIGEVGSALRLREPLYAIRRHAHGRIDDLRRDRKAALDARLRAALTAEAWLAARRGSLPGAEAMRSRLRWRYAKIMRQALKAGSLVHLREALACLLHDGMTDDVSLPRRST